MNVGDTMSTLGDFQYIREYHEYIGDIMSTLGGYHEYIGGCSVHWRGIMIHVGEQLDKILSISIENPNVLNIPRCTEHTLYRVKTILDEIKNLKSVMEQN